MCAGSIKETIEDYIVANAKLSLLVQSSCEKVTSPVDGSPIKLSDLMSRDCLFGDMVDVVSRMESNGIPDFVHCSNHFIASLCRVLSPTLSNENGDVVMSEGSTFNIGDFQLRCRCIIDVKGKSPMRTFCLPLIEDYDAMGPELKWRFSMHVTLN